MNRRILLGISIVIGVGAIFFQLQKLQKNKKLAQEDLASTATVSNSLLDKKIEKNESGISTNTIRNPNTLVEPKSGKYSLHITKPMSPIEDEIKKREQYLNTNNAGLVFKSSDQKLILMKLRASKNKDNLNDKALGHELFPVDIQFARKVIVDDNSYPVVYRESNGRLGLLTGVILIQTQNRIEADKLALHYPMDLQNYDSTIELAAYKVHDGEDFYAIFNSIKENEQFKSITVEVLDSYKGF